MLSLRPSTLSLASAGLALLTVTTVAGCGKSSSSSSATAPTSKSSSAGASASTAPSTEASTSGSKNGVPDPCSLLTTAEASSYLGGAATHGAAKASFRGVTCVWNAGTSYISVAVFKGKEFYSPAQQAPDAKKLSGVGDDAFVSQALAGAIKGDIVVVIGGYGSNDHFTEALKAAIGRV